MSKFFHIYFEFSVIVYVFTNRIVYFYLFLHIHKKEEHDSGLALIFLRVSIICLRFIIYTLPLFIFIKNYHRQNQM